MTNNNFADAEPVVIATAGGTYNSGSVSNAGYDVETDEPPSLYGSTVIRSAWWSYLPATGGSVTVSTAPGAPVDTQLEVFEGLKLAELRRIAYDDDSGTGLTSLLTFTAVPGILYYIRVSSWEDTTETYVLSVTGPDTMDSEDVPPADFRLDSAHSNDQITGAYPVEIATHGGTYSSGLVHTYGYLDWDEVTPNEPLIGYRTAWWTYTPLVSGQATADTTLSELVPTSINASVFMGLNILSGEPTFEGLSIDELDTSDPISITWDVVAGTTYHIVAWSLDDEDLAYNLRVVGPRSLGLAPTEVVANPIDITVDVPADGVLFIDTVLVYPEENTSMFSRRPVFKVQLATETTGTELTVEVQYSTSTSFTSPVTLSKDVEIIGTTAIVTLAATVDIALSPTTYYWRARWKTPDYTSAWTYHTNFPSAGWFASNPPQGLSGNMQWNVDTTKTPDPHLWAAHPSRGVPGDTVTLYGHGFPDSGTVTLAGEEADIEDWDHVAATPAAGTSSRVLQPGVLVDPEHDEVVVTIPNVDPPGGSLVVE